MAILLYILSNYLINITIGSFLFKSIKLISIITVGITFYSMLLYILKVKELNLGLDFIKVKLQNFLSVKIGK